MRGAHAGAPPPRRMTAHEMHCNEVQCINGKTQLGNICRALPSASTEGCEIGGKGATSLGGVHHHTPISGLPAPMDQSAIVARRGLPLDSTTAIEIGWTVESYMQAHRSMAEGGPGSRRGTCVSAAAKTTVAGERPEEEGELRRGGREGTSRVDGPHRVPPHLHAERPGRISEVSRLGADPGHPGRSHTRGGGAAAVQTCSTGRRKTNR